jgi:hypothetical protein
VAQPRLGRMPEWRLYNIDHPFYFLPTADHECLLKPEDVVPAWKRLSPIFCGPRAFTALAPRAETKRPSSKPFVRRCASASGSPPISPRLRGWLTAKDVAKLRQEN